MAELVDAVIVGSGAGGGALALSLSQAGFRVVVLEKGRHHRATDYAHDELRVVRRDFFVPFTSDEPHGLRSSADEPAAASTFGWTACCVGGGTSHWAGYAFRYRPEDFRRGAGGGAADWPLSYAELEPWYERAEWECGVSGLAGADPHEPPRRNPYPLAPLRCHPLAEALDRVAAARGSRAFPTPRAVLSAPFAGRGPCSYCALCASYGCETGARGGVAEALLPRALATGRCELRANCRVLEVRVDAGGLARSVVYRDATGVDREQPARIVVLACGAVETPRLLLYSTSTRFPQGLANSSGLVGKHLAFVVRGAGTADFRLGAHDELPGLASHEPFLGRSLRMQHGGGLLVFDLAHPGPIHVAERLSEGSSRLWGKALKDRLRAWYRDEKHVRFEAFDAPDAAAGNTVDLDPTLRDRSGVPAARITFARSPREIEASRASVRFGAGLLEELRAEAVGALEAGASFDVLQGGTCRMGRDPAGSVVDPECRAHDVPNLYVVDGSVLPSMGAAPPTLTILANSFRVADAIRRRAVTRDLPRSTQEPTR